MPFGGSATLLKGHFIHRSPRFMPTLFLGLWNPRKPNDMLPVIDELFFIVDTVMWTPGKGKCSVAEYEISRQTEAVHREGGLCPAVDQVNRLMSVCCT